MSNDTYRLLQNFSEYCNATLEHPCDAKRFIKFIAHMVKEDNIASWGEVHEILTGEMGWTHEWTRLWANQYFHYLEAIQYVKENECLRYNPSGS